MRGRAAAWLGGTARIAAWVALVVVFAIAFAAAWQAVAGAAADVALFDAIVTAAAALAAGALLMRAADGRSPAALGIALSRVTLRHVGIGVLIGAAGLCAAVSALLITGAVQYRAQDGSASAWLATVVAHAGYFTIAALAEEAVFRGYAFQVLARTGGPAVAIVISSVLFALAHGANPSVDVFALINIFLAGILLAIAYLRTLSLWFATAVHLGWNWSMATFFDLPVSGLQSFDTPLYEPAVGGPAWWSGGLFGPEGGLVGTLGFGVALLLVLRWRAVRPDPAIIMARPLAMRTEEESNVG